MRHPKKGFTLIELMITVVILSVLAAVGIPMFANMIRMNAVSAVTNEMLTGFTYARTEAVRRQTVVSICARNAPEGLGCGDNWRNGWLVFENANQAAAPASQADVLRVGESLRSANDFVFEPVSSDVPSNTLVHFLRLGEVATSNSGDAFQFDLRMRHQDCTPGHMLQRTISLSVIGRAQAIQEECP